MNSSNKTVHKLHEINKCFFASRMNIIKLYAEAKQVLEYGVRAPVSYGSRREQAGEICFPRAPTRSLCCSYRNVRKSLQTSGNLRDNVS